MGSESLSIHSVRLLAASPALVRFELRASPHQRRRNPRRIIAAAVAALAATFGGIAAVHAAGASAANTRTPPVLVDPSSNPGTALNQVLSAQIGPTAAPSHTAPKASLPELGPER